MSEASGYAVFFFPQALEALGVAVHPYLADGPAGPYVPCREVDTGGPFVELTLEGKAPDGRTVEVELMVPGQMVRMIVSARSDSEFGFYDRNRSPQVALEPGMKPAAAPAQTSVAAPTPETTPKPAG